MSRPADPLFFRSFLKDERDKSDQIGGFRIDKSVNSEMPAAVTDEKLNFSPGKPLFDMGMDRVSNVVKALFDHQHDETKTEKKTGAASQNQ